MSDATVGLLILALFGVCGLVIGYLLGKIERITKKNRQTDINKEVK